MATVADQHTTFRTLADLQDRLGDVPAERVCMSPLPGTATRDDLIRLSRIGRGRGLYELVAGTLVEKTLGRYESSLAMWMGMFLGQFLTENPIGQMTAPDGAYDTIDGHSRLPDVGFVTTARVVAAGAENDSVMPIPPDLAVEILSPGNTPKEMDNKLREYFAAGVRLVWYVEPRAKTVRVFTSPENVTELSEDDTLDGGDVLPGFELSIREWFQRAEVSK